ncbi:MAG: HD-GYP domain-containing protein, partial [Clostridiaceae bacterium]|nr:HD-GYP domain-containing protein [Clostridiaceae bacterium]
EPGMVTAEAVINRFGNVLIWENTILNKNIIQHLKNMGIHTVAVLEERPQITFIQKDKDQSLRQLQYALEYEQNVQKTKKIFDEISSGKQFELEEVKPVLGSLLSTSGTGTNRLVIDSIMQVRRIDEYTYYHCINVSLLSIVIGKWLKLSKEDIEKLGMAALLHDIGKTKISPYILNKPGKLTDEEFEEMKRHSEYGYNIVMGMDNVPPDVSTAILTHHEKEDGSGYPMGLTGDKLNIFSKIITVSDIFDAMTAKRPYRNNDTPFKVFELMQHGSFGVLDPLVLNTFLENITNYYIGSKVRLNTGEIGEVVFMNKLDFSRPVVMVDNRYVDTLVSRTERIVEFL